MAEPQAWIVLDDDEIAPVPREFVHDKQIPWPLVMQEKAPGEPTEFWGPSDLYQRHDFVPGELYVFVPPSRDAHLPSQISDAILLEAGFENTLCPQCGNQIAVGQDLQVVDIGGRRTVVHKHAAATSRR